MPAVECRRFLHTNYNCTDVDLLERWYTTLFELKPVMRTVADSTGNGEAFGIYDMTSSTTVFLYDHRGGRRTTSLELVQWTSPPTAGRPYPAPWYRGVHSVGFSVADLDATVERAEAEGSRVVRRAGGGALLVDPEGVSVEVTGGRERPEASSLRLVCADVDTSVAWYGQLGFTVVERGGDAPGAELWEGDAEHSLTREVAMVATDDSTYALVLTQWSGPVPVGPSYAMPFHQGLYRMAIAVDDVQVAYDALRDVGVARQPPYTFALPGTPITEGLTILFIRDPDGVLVELVQRPRSFFQR